MRLFSSRRESITKDLRDRAAQFEQHYGRKPSQRELAHLAQAANFKTRNPKHGALDIAQAHAGWADKLARTLGVSLASVAPSVWHAATGRATAHAARRASQDPPRTRAGARGAEGGRAGPAGKEHLDPRRCHQVPGPGPAPHRNGPGRSRRAPRRPRRPRAALGVRAGHLPGSPRAGRSPAQLAARRRPQRLPAARRHPVRHARAAGHGRTHAHASPRDQRAAPDPRASRARARRRPRAARRRADRTRGRRAGHAHADRAAHRPGRRGAVGPDRRPARVRHQRPGRLRQDPGADRHRPRVGRGRAGPGGGDHRVAVGPQHPGRRGPGVPQRRPVPGPPPRPPRRPRPGRDRPGAPAGHR